MRVALLGNHQPGLPRGVKPWSTETHWAASFELEGHEVVRIQEGQTKALDVPDLAKGCDLFVWVQTYSLAEQGGTRPERFEMLDRIRWQGIVSVGLHLDRWWGLNRQNQVFEEPWFRMDWIGSADGGHDPEFKQAGVNHFWLPPAVYGPECILGRPSPRYARDVAFVGNWKGGYHAESWHRFKLIERLQEWYGDRLGLWPQGAQIRGRELNELYASTKVIVGDSCYVDGDRGWYTSDRIPETLGRGGFLLHPHTEGVMPDLYKAGEHLDTWPLRDWDELHAKIEHYLAADEDRERIRRAGHDHVKTYHTYQDRVRTVLEVIGA